MEKIILLDSNSLIHRAYYALANSGLKDANGQPTGAVFGFVSMLARLIKEEKPTHLAAAFDLRAPTFRHKMYSAYKGTRKPMPEDLASQMPMLKKLLVDLGVKILEMEGFEADDILGTIAKRFQLPTIIVTGDKDSFQLIDDSTKVCYTKRGITDIVMYDEEMLFDDMKLSPDGVIAYKALRGDVSDNIPGVAGIGEKTAIDLLIKYKTLESVLENASEIPGKLGEKLKAGEDMALLSKQLATIDINVPIACKLEDIAFSYPLPKNAKKSLLELEFSSLIKRLDFSDNDDTDTLFEVIEPKTIEIDSLDQLADTVSVVRDKPITIILGETIRFSVTADTEYVINPSTDLFGGMNFDEVMILLQPIFEADTEKTVYNSKGLMHKLYAYAMKLGGKILDAQILAHLVKGSKYYPTMSAMFMDFGFSDNVTATSLRALVDRLQAELLEKQLDKLYFEIELPLVYVLFDMEVAGIKIEKTVLNQLSDKYTAELESLVDSIYKYAGEPFNINSPKQLSAVLFEKLNLKSRKKNKTGLSVGVEVLTNLYDEHPIIPLLMRYRQIAKLQSTYIDGLKKVIGLDGRIHTDFNQTVTTTGRLSSTDPNLQNIPTRTAEGREIRKAFVAGDGRVLMCADYSQIELRLLAHFSGDENLIRAYKESRDIHASTASEIFGVPEDCVTSEMRRNAKAVNFGIIYGISDFGLAQNLSIGAREAKRYIDKYFETYPKVKEYMDKNVAFALENGYIRTYSGRIRQLTEINSSNHMVREFGKRAAMNMPLQGTAADIIKIAMIKLFDKLKNTSAKMLLQVHDELIIEVDRKDEEAIMLAVKDCMENAIKLAVPLTVNIKVGESWFSAD